MIAKLAVLLHSKLALALVGAMLVGGGGAVVASTTGATSRLTTVFSSFAQNGPHAEATHTSDNQEGDQEQGDQDHDLDGKVTSINTAGSSFVLTVTKEDKTSSAVTVKVNTATKFAGAAKSLGDLKAGMHVEAEGATQSDGSFLATRVEASSGNGDDENEQHEAYISGSVVTVGATSFTVKSEQGTTTITVSGATVFEGGVKSLSDLKAGMHVEVTGVKQSNGSIAAQRVTSESNGYGGA